MNVVEDLRQCQQRQTLAQERYDRHELRVAELAEALRRERSKMNEAAADLDRTKAMREGKADDSHHAPTPLLAAV